MDDLSKKGPSTKARGDAAESAALEYLQARGMRLLARNYRTPGRGGGEIDLIVRAADGTVVFVEVRSRRTAAAGGAGASIGHFKQARIVRAAQHYLLRWRVCPAMRFDAVLIENGQIRWIEAAFDAGG